MRKALAPGDPIALACELVAVDSRNPDLVPDGPGEGACAQAQLHGVCTRHLGGGGEQQPSHHALHILQLNVVGLVDPHRTLDPGAVQVQITDVAVLGEMDLGQGGGAG